MSVRCFEVKRAQFERKLNEDCKSETENENALSTGNISHSAALKTTRQMTRNQVCGAGNLEVADQHHEQPKDGGPASISGEAAHSQIDEAPTRILQQEFRRLAQFALSPGSFRESPAMGNDVSKVIPEKRWDTDIVKRRLRSCQRGKTRSSGEHAQNGLRRLC